MLKDIDTDFIHINFFNQSTYVHPTLIRIYPFKFKNIPSGSFIKCLIKDEKGNDGIALLSSKIIKKINDGSLWSINDPNILTFKLQNDKKKKLLRGGKPLVNPLYQEQFIEWYTNKKRDKVNAYEIFNELLSYNLIEEELSILVGATNMYDDMHYNDYDYYRFKNSTVYNLYIDRVDSTNIERQYDMYTIGYQNIFSNMGSYLVGRVSQIHFDICTAYFCPIDYLTLAENILISGGTIVFDLMQHSNDRYTFNRDLNNFKSLFHFREPILSKKELEDKYNVMIDIDQELITPRITGYKYGSGHLAPQIILSIYDPITKKTFRTDPYTGYIDYCNQNYPSLRFEQKRYSFSNYTYPVPIKIINKKVHIESFRSPIFDFIVNYVMTISERYAYISYKTLSHQQINELINKFLEDRNIVKEYDTLYNKTLTSNTDDDIREYIYNELTKEFEYIEAIKVDSSQFSPNLEQFSKGIRNIPLQRSNFLSSICTSDAGVCLAFGIKKKLINKHFNGFVDFKYLISPVKSIGNNIGANGFVKELTYERLGYRANAVLKSATKQDSDNLLFEYLVGQYINKQCYRFPCFIETYGWYQYNTPPDWREMQKTIDIDAEQLKLSLTIGKDAVQNYIDSGINNNCSENKRSRFFIRKECTEIDYLFKVACAKSTYLSILIQHIKNAASMHSKILKHLDFPSKSLLYVLYQIYMPLATLSETFTHYDLHAENILIYEPVAGKYIDYKYILEDGTIVEFKSRYIAKIIDYGRCFFNDESNKEITGSSKSIYESICKNIPECNGRSDGFPITYTYCGEDQGFSNFDESEYGLGHSINSSVRNITHDLLLLYRVKKILKYRSEHPEELQPIFDNLEYGDEVALEAEELRLGESQWEYGSVEKYDISPLTHDELPEKINNVIDAHNALKTQIIKYKNENDLYHQLYISLGTLTIYQSGAPMQFTPRI
jgi:hypothetical protein